jgi:hypothetical protein
VDDLEKLIKNFTLLSLIEAAKGASAQSKSIRNNNTPKMAVPIL